MLLFPRLGCPNLSRIAYSAFDSHLFQELQEPLHRSRGLDTHRYGTIQGCVKLLYCIPLMIKRLLGELSTLSVHHAYGLLSCVKIAAYSFHIGLLRPELLVGTKSLLGSL